MVVKKIDEGEVSLEGDDLLSVISELGQAIDWLEEVEDKALAFDMLAGIVGKIPADYRLRGIEMLGERLFFIYNACYPETGLDENASDDDDEDSLHAQPLVGSLDRLIDMVENLEEDNDTQARAGIVVAATLILPARGTGNIKRFIRMAEIFKRTEHGDLKVQGINTLMDQIDSIIVDNDDLFEQSLKDLDRAGESIGSVIETINDPTEREEVDKEVTLQIQSSKKAWELINEARREITGKITPDQRLAKFAEIVRKAEDKKIPLNGKNLLGVVSELRDTIKNLHGIQRKVAAFHMLAGIVENMLSGTYRERGVEILAQYLLSIDPLLLREQPWADSLGRLIGIVENFGKEDNDAQARAGLAVIPTLGLPVPGTGNAEGFSRMARIFKGTEDDSLKEQGITALVDQIGSIVVDGDELFAEFLGDLDSVAESIGSIVGTIEDEDARERVDEEVTSRLKALKKVWELTNAARQITGKEPPGASMAQFAWIVKKLKDEEIPLLGEDRFNVISELGDVVKRLEGIQHKATAFYMLSEIVGNIQTSTDRALGVGVLAQILQGIDEYCRLKDGTDSREFVAVLLDKLIDFVEGLEEDNDARARAGIAVSREVNWPAGTIGGIDRLVRMAGIFKRTQNQDLKMRGVEALTGQIGSAIDGGGEDSHEGEQSALEIVGDSLNQIVDTITDEEEKQDTRGMVNMGLNGVYERS